MAKVVVMDEWILQLALNPTFHCCLLASLHRIFDTTM